MIVSKPTLCLACQKEIEGRVDKVFCDAHCRSSYHYQKKKEEKYTLFKQIDLQLKQNRKILKHYNQAGKATVRKEILIKKGFNPRYFTHYWKNRKGDVYLFCYDYGYLSRTENNRSKYVLVKWQDYME
ncbi:MAG TPA: hypothetical protein VJ911_07990 [Cryomorphaceae bacterium]|nr:hypothetical protein [Cryomorphaceae bacterium]